jgi:predicted AlkP superfamily phosphohydrolase/phosphomutase
MKKVLLMIIDACTPRVLDQAMRRGRLPNLLALSEAGFFHQAGSSIYPSITHAAMASLATGCYPA